MIPVEKAEVWRAWGEPEEEGVPIGEVIMRSVHGTPIPDAIAADATARFAAARKANPALYDATVPFLIEASPARAALVIAPRPFRYAYAFGRDESWAFDPKLYASLALGQLGTFVHVLTSDGFLIYARRPDQRNQRTGFGGMLQCDRFTKDGTILVEAALRDRLAPELGMLTGTLVDIRALGITHAAMSFLRSTDLCFLAHSTVTSDIWHERFTRNEQFEGSITLARPDADSLLKAIRTEAEDGGMFCPFAVVSMYLLLRATHSVSDAERFAHGARQLGYPIAVEKGTWYFGEQ